MIRKKDADTVRRGRDTGADEGVSAPETIDAVDADTGEVVRAAKPTGPDESPGADEPEGDGEPPPEVWGDILYPDQSLPGPPTPETPAVGHFGAAAWNLPHNNCIRFGGGPCLIGVMPVSPEGVALAGPGAFVVSADPPAAWVKTTDGTVATGWARLALADPTPAPEGESGSGEAVAE